VFGTILILISSAMHIYVFWRLQSVPWIRRRVPRKVLVGAGVILWAALYLGRTLGHGGSGAAAATIEFAGMTWMASLFLIFVCLFVADLGAGFGFLFRRRAPSVRGWAMAVGVLLSVIALFQGLRPPVVTRYEVRLAGLPAELDGTVLVALSDLHLGSMIGRSWLDARVSQVQALRPDIVVLLGDLVEGHGEPMSEFLRGLRRLTAPLGVWAVSGNHERHGGGDRLASLAGATSIGVLNNRWVEVRPGFVLAGVEYLGSGRRGRRSRGSIARAPAGRPPGATVLLSHIPAQVEKASAAGAGLMLSGHTHAGQIWPFSYFVAPRYPILWGRIEVGGMTLVVCRGTGTWGPRMRLWRPSEILHITLRPGS